MPFRGVSSASKHARYTAQASRRCEVRRLLESPEERSVPVAAAGGSSSNKGVTPLMIAAAQGHADNVTLLLQNGANPWAADWETGRTALHYAAQTDQPEVLQLLIDAAALTSRLFAQPVAMPGANITVLVNTETTRFVDMRTATGYIAVHFAVHNDCQQALGLLISSGAHLFQASLTDSLHEVREHLPRGSTPLHVAARDGNQLAAEQLLKAYVDCWAQRGIPDPRLAKDRNGQLPYNLTLRVTAHDLAQLLLPSTPLGALFDCRGPSGGSQCGPPSLAVTAAAVLRQTLAADVSEAEKHLEPTDADRNSPSDASPCVTSVPKAANAAVGVTCSKQACNKAVALSHGCQQTASKAADAAAAAAARPLCHAGRV